MVLGFQTGGYTEDMIPTVRALQDLLLDGIVAFAFLHVSVSLICILTSSIFNLGLSEVAKIWNLRRWTGFEKTDMIVWVQVGFNMRKVSKGNVTIKLWDLGGQPRFRTMWERYCRGVSAIV